MGAFGGGVTGSLRQPPTFPPQQNGMQCTDADGNASIHHLYLCLQQLDMLDYILYILRLLFCWDMRSLLMPARHLQIRHLPSNVVKKELCYLVCMFL